MTHQLMTRANFAGYALRFMLAAAVTVSASCSDLARSGKSPVYLILERLDAAPGDAPNNFGAPFFSDVQFVDATTTTVFNDIGRATIRAELKNTTLGPTAATSVNTITLTRYRVTFKRADGRNTAGVDVPYGFDGVVTRTVAIGASQPVIFDLVRHQNKMEPPLRNLINGGGLGFITTIAEITFYGHDQAGNEVTTAGSLDVQFGDIRNQ